MDIIWQWNTLSSDKSIKLQFANFVVSEIVTKRYTCDLVYTLTLVCLIRFLKHQNCIASVFFNAFQVLETEMISKIKHVRLQIKDDVHVEIIARLYDFIPLTEIKIFIDGIRIQHNNNSDLSQSLHSVRCNYFNANPKHLDYLMQHHEKNDFLTDICISNLVFDVVCLPFYSSYQYVLAYSKKHTLPQQKKTNDYKDYFQYDIRFVPAVPNTLFLTQLFESIDALCIDKQYLSLLLNHLENLMEDGYLFLKKHFPIALGILAKMLIYKLSADPQRIKLFLLQECKQEKDVFICFLIKKALNEEPNWDQLKENLVLMTQSQFKIVLHLK